MQILWNPNNIDSLAMLNINNLSCLGRNRSSMYQPYDRYQQQDYQEYEPAHYQPSNPFQAHPPQGQPNDQRRNKNKRRPPPRRPAPVVPQPTGIPAPAPVRVTNGLLSQRTPLIWNRLSLMQNLRLLRTQLINYRKRSKSLLVAWWSIGWNTP